MRRAHSDACNFAGRRIRLVASGARFVSHSNVRAIFWCHRAAESKPAREWSAWVERHGRLSRKGVRLNAAGAAEIQRGSTLRPTPSCGLTRMARQRTRSAARKMVQAFSGNDCLRRRRTGEDIPNCKLNSDRKRNRLIFLRRSSNDCGLTLVAPPQNISRSRHAAAHCEGGYDA